MTTDEQYTAIRAALANILIEVQKLGATVDDLTLAVNRAVDVSEQARARSLVAEGMATTALERMALNGEVPADRDTDPEGLATSKPPPQ